MTRLNSFLAFIFIGMAYFAFAQEKAVGLSLHSRSFFIGGIDYKITYPKPPKSSIVLNFSLANIKHQKEFRINTIPSNINTTLNLLGNRPIIYEKMNYFYSMRAQAGKQFNLFSSAKYEGVKVNFLIMGGVSLGIIKPYFIKYEQPDGVISKVSYDPIIHTDLSRILGPMSAFYFPSKISFVPGLNFKSALVFEHETFRRHKSLLELGTMVEIYPKRIEIVNGGQQDFFYSFVYLTYYISTKK